MNHLINQRVCVAAVRTLFLLAVALAMPLSVQAQAQSQEYRVLQNRPDRLIVELPNRLVVIVQEVHTSPVVSAQVWVKTGSIYEQEHVGAGLSHFLEHLISGGTTTQRSEADNNRILGEIGGRTNAATSLDTVRYYINTTSPYASQAVDLLSDWLQHSKIEQAEYERERQVIQREFEMGQGEPGRIFWKLTQQARYTEHPARHPTIGYLDEFLSISRDEIYDFYKRMYVPNNMIFVVAGDVDRHAVVQQITELWKDSKPGELPKVSLPDEGRIEQPREGTGYADIRLPQMRMAWPSTRLGKDGDYALDILGVVLGQGESSRLVRALRDQARLVNSVSAYNWSMEWGEGYFGIDADLAASVPGVEGELTTERHMQMVRDAVFAEIQKVIDEGVTEEEMARAKRKTLASVVYSAQSVESLASRLVSDSISMGDPDYLRRYAELIQDVTAEQVQAAAKQYLQAQRTISLSLLPTPEGEKPAMPTRPEEPEHTLPRKAVDLDNAALIAKLQAKLNQPSAAKAAVEIGPMEMHRLSNGLRVVIQRSTQVPAVAMQMYALGGLLADEPGHEGVAAAATSMLIKGTTTRSAQDISQSIEDLGARLSTQSGNNTFYTQAACLTADWRTVLDLFADVTLRPSFDAEEWGKLQPRIVAAIERENDSWGGELRSAFRQAYYAGHPWATSTLGRADVVRALTPEDLRAFYMQRLGAADAVLAIIGDIDPAEVLKEVEAKFGAMPAKAPIAFELRMPNPPQAATVIQKTNKPLAAVQIGYGPGGVRTDEDYPAMQVLTRVLSSFPTGWLESELRGQGEGLVYAVGAYYATGVVPGYTAVVFNTQPSKAAEATERALAVVARARETLVDDATLARAKASVLTDEFFGKQTNSDRAAEAALGELYGVGLNASEQFLEAVKALDAAALQAVAKKRLAETVMVTISQDAAVVEEPADATP